MALTTVHVGVPVRTNPHSTAEAISPPARIYGFRISPPEQTDTN
jgi:hypothetical protein